MFDWNDLRYFLAVARTGSTMAASRDLKVSQATVSRRIGVLEAAVGTPLFVRKPSGYTLTPRGTAVLTEAELVEHSVLAFSAAIAAESRRLTGVVRLTTVEVLANDRIIPALPRFRTSHPDIQVEILTTDQYLDLVRGEADVAVRFGSRPDQDTLIIRHLLNLEETIYATRGLVDQFGIPASLAEIGSYPYVIIGTPQGLAFHDAWLGQIAPDLKIAHKASSMSALTASVKAGLGAAVLPCIQADSEPDLVRLFDPIPELMTPCWLVTTDAARRQPHIRAVMDFIIELFDQFRSDQSSRHGDVEPQG